jgi:hypothetical protein
MIEILSTTDRLSHEFAYSIYQGINFHFNKDFNPFDYGFKSPTITIDKLKKKPYYPALARVADKKSPNDFLLYCLANVTLKKDCIVDYDEESFKVWYGSLNQMAYTFERDIIALSEQVGKNNFDKLFEVDKPGGMPFIYKYECRASLETLAILNLLVNFTVAFEKNYADPLEAIKSKSRFIRSYQDYIHPLIDLKKTLSVIKESFTL